MKKGRKKKTKKKNDDRNARRAVELEDLDEAFSNEGG